MKYKAILLGLVVFLLVANGVLAATLAYQIPRSVMGAGGDRVAAGSYILEGTVGQAIAGDVSAGTYKLHSGFWINVGPFWFYLPAISK
jgi:hypothetical protein